jgi:cytochrome b
MKSVHEPAGYALLLLVVLRIGWGLVGSRHARFASFAASPAAVLRYLRLLSEGRAPRYLGHNPAGSVMIVLLLATLLLAAVSGWMTETDRWFGVAWVDALHHITGNLVLPLAAVHVVGVTVSSWLHRENLVRAMFTGRKRAQTAGNVTAG